MVGRFLAGIFCWMDGRRDDVLCPYVTAYP